LMIVTITWLKTKKLIPLSLNQIQEPEVIKQQL
jgi:hypothetical protein